MKKVKQRNTYCAILFISHSGKDKMIVIKANRGMLDGVRIDCKVERGNFSGVVKIFIYQLWWWICNCIHFFKKNQMYTSN